MKGERESEIIQMENIILELQLELYVETELYHWSMVSFIFLVEQLEMNWKRNVRNYSHRDQPRHLKRVQTIEKPTRQQHRRTIVLETVISESLAEQGLIVERGM